MTGQAERIQPNIVHEVGDIVLRLKKEEGLTVLLVEEKLPFARREASEFCILDKGRRVAAGSIVRIKLVRAFERLMVMLPPRVRMCCATQLFVEVADPPLLKMTPTHALRVLND